MTIIHITLTCLFTQASVLWMQMMTISLPFCVESCWNFTWANVLLLFPPPPHSRGWGWCLDDAPVKEKLPLNSQLPGVLYSAAHQCRLQYGSGSLLCDDMDVRLCNEEHISINTEKWKKSVELHFPSRQSASALSLLSERYVSVTQTALSCTSWVCAEINPRGVPNT